MCVLSYSGFLNHYYYYYYMPAYFLVRERERERGGMIWGE